MLRPDGMIRVGQRMLEAVALPAVTTQFTDAQVAPGWTLFTDSVIASGKRRLAGNSDQGGSSAWAGWITGTDAKMALASEFGTTDAQIGNLYLVSVDGGAPVATSARDANGEYSLFTGLADAPHFVVVTVNPANTSYAQYAWQLTTGNSLRVTGAAPALATAGEWSQIGDSAAKGISPNGLIPTVSDARHGASRVPLNRAAYNVTVNSIAYAKTGRIGSQAMMAVKTDATELWVVCQSRYAFVYDGVSVTAIDTNAIAGIGGIGSAKVRVARFSGLPAGMKTLLVYASANTSNPFGGWFSVGVPQGKTFSALAMPQAHLFGDSITQGVDPRGSALNEADSGQTDTIRAFWKRGYVPGNFGVAGSAFTDYNATGGYDPAVMLQRLTVTASDVAYVALGQNGTPVQADVQYLLNQLIAKGYGKIVVRGVLPLAIDTGNTAVTAKNNTIQAAITAIGDARIRYIDPMGWTEIRVNTAGIRDDGIHFTPAGFNLLMARMDAALPAALA